MSNKGKIESVNISVEKGTIKQPAERIVFDERGIKGDAHAGAWHRQVSMLSREQIDVFIESSGRDTKPGEFAENITTTGLDLNVVAPLDRFSIGDVELQVTQIGKECHGDACAIFREVGTCVMPKQGLFMRVLHGGEASPGDEIVYTPRPFRVRVITLSDRAAAGEYEDRSGPAIRELLDEFFDGERWHVETESSIMPDDPAQLRRELDAAAQAGADLIITTGGTGVGPRDIAPEVAEDFCDKLIPGIMDHVRLKFGAKKPGALLSRSVAGVKGTAQVYTLPGSVKAVREYMGEILKNVEHLIFTLHAIDRH